MCMACTHLYILSMPRGLHEGSGLCIFKLFWAATGLQWINSLVFMHVDQTQKARLGAETSKCTQYSCNSDVVISLTLIQTSEVVGHWCMSIVVLNGLFGMHTTSSNAYRVFGDLILDLLQCIFRISLNLSLLKCQLATLQRQYTTSSSSNLENMVPTCT